MINYIRKTDLWREALAITEEQEQEIHKFFGNIIHNKIEEIKKITEKLKAQHLATFEAIEQKKEVDMEAVFEESMKIMEKLSSLQMNVWVEDAEVYLLSKAIYGTPNIMCLVGYHTAKAEENITTAIDTLIETMSRSHKVLCILLEQRSEEK